MGDSQDQRCTKHDRKRSQRPAINPDRTGDPKRKVLCFVRQERAAEDVDRRTARPELEFSLGIAPLGDVWRQVAVFDDLRAAVHFDGHPHPLRGRKFGDDLRRNVASRLDVKSEKRRVDT